jgi:hypothetical protein
MRPDKPLAPSLIGRGTVSAFPDMLRVLETLENLEYRYVVDGQTIDEGTATLVKLMADDVSATLIVNSCLFLNVASYRFLDFARDADGRWVFSLHADGALLELVALPEPEDDQQSTRPHLLSEELPMSIDALIALEDDDEDD